MADFGDAINASTQLAIEASSESQYEVGMGHFNAFCTSYGIPSDWYRCDDDAHAQIVMCAFVEHLRNTRKSTLPCGGPIQAKTINEYVTHVVRHIGEPFASRLRSDKLTDQIAKYTLQDIDVRGPKASWTSIPIGCELTGKIIDHFRVQFKDDPMSCALYSAMAALYYGAGSRVRELGDRDNPECPRLAPSGRQHKSHSAHACDICFLDPNTSVWVPSHDVDALPISPLAVSVHLSHTKNAKQGPPPIVVYRNPKGTDAPFCVPTIVRSCAAMLRRKSGDVFFKGVEMPIMTGSIRTVGGSNGLAENRLFPRGWRSGSCMSISEDVLFGVIASTQQKVKQNAQGWAAGGERPYDKGTLSVGQAKALSLYDPSINSIADCRAMYMRDFPVS